MTSQLVSADRRESEREREREREREIYRLKDEEMKERKETSGCGSAESSDTKVELTRCKCGKEMVSSLGKNTARLYLRS